MFIDSHSHIDSEPFISDIEGVLGRMKEADVRGTLVAGCSLHETERTLAFAQSHENVWASVGVHPSTEDDPHEVSVEELVFLSAHPKVVAIGECGLDYFYNKEPLDWQRERFAKHIEAAKEAKLPLIIHSRDAAEDTIRILKEGGAGECGFVLHCFTGDENMARQALDLGGYLSFSGIVTFKNAKNIQEVASWVPSDRYFIETDSPYLAPIPYRGKRNEPSYVVEVAKKLSQLRSVPLEQIGAESTENFFRFFHRADRSSLNKDL